MTVASTQNQNRSVQTAPAQALPPAPSPDSSWVSSRIATSSAVRRAARTRVCSTPQRNAAYLAHDTRNWLTVLRVYCDLLRTPGTVASGHQNWIDELSDAVDRGEELVRSLLDSVQDSGEGNGRIRISTDRTDPLPPPSLGSHRAVSGGPAIPDESAVEDSAEFSRTPEQPPAPLDIAAALHRRKSFFEMLVQSGVQVQVDAPTGVGEVALSESAFDRILHNLVRNALEAMPGGGYLRISLRRGSRRSRRAGRKSKLPTLRTVRLRVSDTGEGIAPEDMHQIFEAGVSRKAAGEAGRRRGFGLAIVRELAECAGGTVRVRSQRGRGTCFEVEWPQA